MKKTLTISATVIIFIMSFFCYINSSLADSPSPNNTRVWNLQDADILSVINEVSLETGKNFIIDPRVTGKISLISSKPIKSADVYQVFLSVLDTLGYSALPTGSASNLIKIIPNTDSNELAKVANPHSPGKGEEVVIRLIPLENISAAQLVPTIRPLLPQWSNVSVYTPGNILILVGHAANLQRIIEIIQDIDSPDTNSIDVVPLHQASANQVASVLASLQNAAKANGNSSTISIAADERSNSVLLSGNRTARVKMRLLISQLDTPLTGSQGNTEVIYLRYLQADKLAPLLGKIAANMQQTGRADLSESLAISETSHNDKAAPENHTTIQAEPNTNALIVTAPPTLMRSISQIISKLDVRPAQVLVEAVIVEVSQDDMKNLGIQWGSYNNGAAIESASTTGASAQVSFPPLGAGTLGIIPRTQIKAVLSLLQNKTGVNILSTPSIVVLDNQKATLKVGKDVPDQTGSYATTGNTSTVSPFNTIGRKLVALQLAVTPQINLGNAVRLKINLTNDSLQNPDNPGLNPLINTSQIENSVIINSNDILVLGGLISNNITETEDKVPLLGDIPLLGHAFKHTERKLEKRNLIAFIKPTILHSPDEALMATNTKYNQVRELQIHWPNKLHTKTVKQQNILPPWTMHLPEDVK